MLTTTNNGEVDLGQYRPLISYQLSDQLTDVASKFKGLRIVHLNSTAKGEGVAEFFQMTKRTHNLLQGAPGTLSAEELKTYFGSIETVADQIRDGQGPCAVSGY